ncbi:unnamed protein product, partial [Discosporangium mesarthrocarpum]
MEREIIEIPSDDEDLELNKATRLSHVKKGKSRGDAKDADPLDEAVENADIQAAIRNSLGCSTGRGCSSLLETRNQGGPGAAKRQRRGSTDVSRPPLWRLNLISLHGCRGKHARMSISDILSGNFESVLLVNYMFESGWLLAAVPRLRQVPVMIAHGMDPNAMAVAFQPYPNITLCKPKVDRFGCHHSKVALVKYDRGLRVAIFTANLVESDWTGMVQGIWFQDFPILGQAKGGDKGKGGKERCVDEAGARGDGDDSSIGDGGGSRRPNDFRVSSGTEDEVALGGASEDTLWDYICKTGNMVKTFVRDLSLYDFSRARAVLVPSVPGRHRGEALHKYGHMRVRSLLQGEAFAGRVREKDMVSAQFSSLATVTGKGWLDELVASFMAEKGKPGGASATGFTAKDRLRLVWPTAEAVRTSLRGWASGSSMPCSSANMYGRVETEKALVDNQPQPPLNHLLHKWREASGQGNSGAMPHIKSYARYWARSGNEEELGGVGWFLLTSANLSKSAWGNLEKGGTQLHVRSFELGVMFLPSMLAGAKSGDTVHDEFTCTPGLATNLALSYSLP